MDYALTRGGDFGRTEFSMNAKFSAFDEIDEIDINTGKRIEEAGGSERENEATQEVENGARRTGHWSLAGKSISPPTTKWRFSGPFLQNMNPKELSRWLEKKVKPRKAEFMRHIKRWSYLKDNSRLSSLPNREPTEQEIEQIKINLPSIRSDPMTLEELVISFLDLPTTQPPPVTHPSAGLHYIRSPAFLPNHPYTGPEPISFAIPGRQLTGRGSITLAGISGLIAKVIQVDNAGYFDREPAILRENREVMRWYKPIWAIVDHEGAVLLEVRSSAPPPETHIGPGADTARPLYDEHRRRMEEHYALQQYYAQEQLNWQQYAQMQADQAQHYPQDQQGQQQQQQQYDPYQQEYYQYPPQQDGSNNNQYQYQYQYPPDQQQQQPQQGQPANEHWPQPFANGNQYEDPNQTQFQTPQGQEGQYQYPQDYSGTPQYQPYNPKSYPTQQYPPENSYAPQQQQQQQGQGGNGRAEGRKQPLNPTDEILKLLGESEGSRGGRNGDRGGV